MPLISNDTNPVLESGLGVRSLQSKKLRTCSLANNRTNKITAIKHKQKRK